MRVKIGDTWVSSENEPVAVELSDGERAQIAAMEPGTRVYCQYPDTMEAPSIRIWMADGARVTTTKTEKA